MASQIERKIIINAASSLVWHALTGPELNHHWMGDPEMNLEIITDWKTGSNVLIKGFHHTTFENRGTVLR